MPIYCVSISVYDTTLPEIPVISNTVTNFAAINTVRLVYDGGDTKYNTIMASQLNFSLEVPHTDLDSDLYYAHLFSGNEKKYNVVMADQDGNILWNGFLLPDEYSEPYTVGTFYVNFTATDGLGRLKGVKLPVSFYTARQSAVKVLSDCLLQTGLSLPIYIDPAIVNDGAGSHWEKLYVDASVWYEVENRSDCYQILEDVLTLMSCRIFQQENIWYIVGYNKQAQNSNYYLKYTAKGIPDGFLLDVNPGSYLKWDASPSVTLKPPFKEITVVSGAEESQTVFPSEYFTQDWVKNDEPQNPPRPKYWSYEGAGEVSMFPKSGYEFQEYVNVPLEISSAIGFNQISGVTDATKFDSYLDLTEPIYIKGGFEFDFKLVFKYRFLNPNYGGFDFDTYVNNNMWYDLILDGVAIISNRSVFTGNESFRWRIANKITETDYLEYTFTVEANKIPVATSGFLDFRFYNGETVVSGADNGGMVIIDTVGFSYREPFQKEFSKRRRIDFTKTDSISLKFGDSVLSNVKEAIIYQPEIDENLFTPYNFEAFFAYDTSGNPIGWVASVTQSIYNLFSNASNGVYVKLENSDYYQYIPNPIFIEDGTANYILIDLENNYRLEVSDTLLLRPGNNTNPQTTTVRNDREQWQKSTNSSGPDRLGNASAELLHDIYSKQQIVFEGDTVGLVFPNTRCTYTFGKNIRSFIPVRIEQKIGENASTVTLIERTNIKVTDYE